MGVGVGSSVLVGFFFEMDFCVLVASCIEPERNCVDFFWPRGARNRDVRFEFFSVKNVEVEE